MSRDPGGLRRWTQRFTVASAAAFVVSCVAAGVVSDPRIPVILALFGFVCPMIFGMAYLLLPPYVRRTLVDHRLPGIHFVLAFPGAGSLVLGTAIEGLGLLRSLGAVVWSLGVLVFVGALFGTVVPAVLDDPASVFRGGDRPQRSTRLATATIPIAIGYLLLGTMVLVQSTSVVSAWDPTLVSVIHLYAVGFGALLIFSLGARLLLGFYRASPPKSLLWLVLVAGAVAPMLLGFTIWVDPWFRVGAALESIAMVGYAIVVGITGYRTERRRFGYVGIAFGAVAGVLAVAVAAPVAFGTPVLDNWVSLHRTTVLWGFFPLTIVGYAFLFFPVTDGQFRGATRRVATTTIVLLAVGLLIRLFGIAAASEPVRLGGVATSVVGALLYCYLLIRRFYG